MLILTEGHTNPHTAKTASCLIRYCSDEVVALLDSTQAGKTTQELLGVGGDLPVVAALDAAPQAKTLLLGIAPPGGKIPQPWRKVILAAIARGMPVISGLHDFLSEDPEFTEAAKRHGVALTDVRKNDERDVARRKGLNEKCLRILTVGHDCSVGKMVASVELTKALKARGHDAKFIATGQTGIMVEGDGCPIDRVIADFVSGAVEKMVLKNQHREMLIIEGQGSLIHPSYSGVTLSLLHGAFPHALIFVYEIGRQTVTGVDHVRIPPLKRMIEINETMASVERPCRVIGVAMNSSKVSDAAANAERDRVRAETGLPVADLIRHGSDELVDAILRFKQTEWRP
jgi:uncharacterized NAD-dependent epimerase/dehydratase family protein